MPFASVSSRRGAVLTQSAHILYSPDNCGYPAAHRLRRDLASVSAPRPAVRTIRCYSPNGRGRRLEDMIGAAERTWSTGRFRPESQFAAWVQIVGEAFTPVTLSRLDDAPGFSSSCAVRRIGELTLSRLISPPQHVERSTEHIAQGGCGVYFLNLPLRGCGTASQGGRVAVTRPGDFVLIDGDRPFQLDFGDSFDQIAVMIPKALLDPLLADPHAHTAIVVSATSPLGATVSGALRGLARQSEATRARDATILSDHLVPMIAAAVVSSGPHAPAHPRVAFVQAAIDEIERRYADPRLAPADIARALNISVSYLTKLLSDSGESFGRRLLARRLQHAWVALDPAFADERTITEIALGCGFSDSAHFARVFRARFGLTPRQRRSALARPARADGTVSA